MTNPKKQISRLCTLPPELIDGIAPLLEPCDLCSLRLTCRILYQKTFSAFWRTSLRAVKTDLSCTSLHKLQSISNNQQLRGYVRHLTITGFDRYGGEESSRKRNASGHLIDPLQQQPAKQLRQILCQLSNCGSFEILSLDTFNTRPYPWIDSNQTDAVPMVLDILSQTRNPVTSLSLTFVGRSEAVQSLLESTRFPTDPAHFTALGAHLEELILYFEVDEVLITNWTSGLFSHVPKLRRLDIEFVNSTVSSHTMHHLAVSESSCPRLQEVKLEFAEISGEDFCALLQKCQHALRVLILRSVRIKTSLKEMREILETLGTDFPSLETIDFWDLMSGSSGYELVHFPAISENPIIDESLGMRFGFESARRAGEERNIGVNYSGPKMNVAMDMLASMMAFVWRNRYLRDMIERNAANT